MLKADNESLALFDTYTKPVSGLMATPRGWPPVLTVSVAATPVMSTTEALLLPSLATTAWPVLGSTATPAGLVPTANVESTLPYVGLPGLISTTEILLLPVLVTTATSRSGSMATACGAVPTAIG